MPGTTLHVHGHCFTCLTSPAPGDLAPHFPEGACSLVRSCACSSERGQRQGAALPSNSPQLPPMPISYDTRVHGGHILCVLGTSLLDANVSGRPSLPQAVESVVLVVSSPLGSQPQSPSPWWPPTGSEPSLSERAAVGPRFMALLLPCCGDFYSPGLPGESRRSL